MDAVFEDIFHSVPHSTACTNNTNVGIADVVFDWLTEITIYDVIMNNFWLIT